MRGHNIPIYLPKDRTLGGFPPKRASAEKQKVNLNWMTFNYFVDQTLRISNLSFIEGLLAIYAFSAGT